ncbi:hypothetical protein ACETK8_07630 [Brevundimonas staleyi]|uniref:Lipoprotein n=1 Tax=Brevundimonas staleyi TaxID=74326 RepID=A0ABW0FNG2_9CAUL
MVRPALVTALGAITLTACATTPEPSGPPDYTPIATLPAPRAKLYADCIAQAATAGRYGRAEDGVHVVVFTCDGVPARAFFDGLADFSAAANSEVEVGDRVIRSTTRIERDLFAADYCEHSGGAYSCSISLRTGEFVLP